MTGLLGAVLAAASGRRVGRRRPGGGLRAGGVRLRRPARPFADGHLRRRAVARPLPGALGPRDPLQHRPRARERRLRAGRRPGAGADAAALPAAASSSPGAPGRRRRPPGAAAGDRRRCARCLLALGAGSRPRSAARPPKAAAAGAASPGSRAAQNADGGFGADAGGASSPAMTGWAVLGLEAAGVHPLDVRRGGPRALAYLRATAAEISTTGDIERTILVLAAAGLDPRRFAGPRPGRAPAGRARRRRLLGRPGEPDGLRHPRPGGGRAGARATGARPPGCAARATSDGGWGFAPGAASDADSTGAALQALAAAGGSRGALAPAVGYLRGAQRAGGGFALAGGGTVNAQSTAWAVQGLVAAGVSPGSACGGAAARRSTTSRSSRPATATTATRAPATRPRSGSPRRRCWRSSGAPFPLPAVVGASRERAGAAAPARRAAAPRSGVGAPEPREGAGGRRRGAARRRGAGRAAAPTQRQTPRPRSSGSRPIRRAPSSTRTTTPLPRSPRRPGSSWRSRAAPR